MPSGVPQCFWRVLIMLKMISSPWWCSGGSWEGTGSNIGGLRGSADGFLEGDPGVLKGYKRNMKRFLEFSTRLQGSLKSIIESMNGLMVLEFQGSLRGSQVHLRTPRVQNKSLSQRSLSYFLKMFQESLSIIRDRDFSLDLTERWCDRFILTKRKCDQVERL